MVVTHVILQLVTARELLSTGSTSVRGLCHAVQGAAQLAPALPCVHHLLDLEQTRGHLQQPRHIDTAEATAATR